MQAVQLHEHNEDNMQRPVELILTEGVNSRLEVRSLTHQVCSVSKKEADRLSDISQFTSPTLKVMFSGKKNDTTTN